MDTSLFNVEHGTTSDPAVGVNLTVEGMENARSQLLLLRFTLVTDANAADRLVILNVGKPGDTIEVAQSDQKHIQGETRQYAFVIDGQQVFNTTSDTEIITLPSSFFLFEVWRVFTAITNIQVGDQISNVRWQMKFWTYEQ